MKTILLAALALALAIPQAYAQTTESLLAPAAEAPAAVIHDVAPVAPSAEAPKAVVKKAVKKAAQKKAVKKAAKKKIAKKQAKKKAAKAPSAPKRAAHAPKAHQKMRYQEQYYYPVDRVYEMPEGAAEAGSVLTSGGSTPIYSSSGAAIRVGQ